MSGTNRSDASVRLVSTVKPSKLAMKALVPVALPPEFVQPALIIPPSLRKVTDSALALRLRLANIVKNPTK